MEEKELFEDYEIGSWQISPRIYQVLGASALVHLLVFFTLAQFNLLQTKACDSPYVGRVCQVLDAAYLSSTFLGTDPAFVNEDYDKTEIADADITYIDVSRIEPPLKYPDGYFALANPDQMSTMPTDPMGQFGSFPSEFPNPSINTSPNTLDLKQPQILPTPNNNITNQDLPDSPFGFSDDIKPAPMPKPARVPAYRPPRNRVVVKNNQPKIKNESPTTLPNLDGKDETAKNNSNSNTNTNQVAKNDPKTTDKPGDKDADDQNKLFNQKPLKDFGTKYGEQILNKSIDINAPFTIEIIGKLDENGKILDAKMQSSAGSDPKMTEVAKEAISAFSDSRLLQTLYNIGGRDIKIKFAQNQDNLQAIIQTQTKSENEAKRMSSGLNLIMSGVKMTRQGSDEATLMEKAELSAQGKIFTINFLITNDQKNQMIEKSLKNLKQELEQKKTQPNSVAVNNNKSPNV